MPTDQQENFGQMVAAVLEYYPRMDKAVVQRRINDHIRIIVDRRPWSGLVCNDVLHIPDEYHVGTVTVTLNSNVVTGSGTTWAFSDVVSTTLSVAITETGMQQATPTAMTNIEAGRWLLVGTGTGNEEAVFVTSIDSSLGTFTANFTKTHAAAVTITSSSMSGRQFRTSDSTPFYTIVGVSSATRLLINRTWQDATAATQSYTIVLVYATFGRSVKTLWSVLNTNRNYQLRLDIPKVRIDYSDPRRQTTEAPYFGSYFGSDPGGAPLYELYPRPTTAQSMPYTYVRSWAPLVRDDDILPNGIRSDVLIKRAWADCARWPKHKTMDGGIYYDAALATQYMTESELEIALMQVADDGTNIMTMFYQYRNWPYSERGDSWLQAHDAGYYGSI